MYKDFDSFWLQLMVQKYGTDPEGYTKSINKRLDRIYSAQRYALGFETKGRDDSTNDKSVFGFAPGIPLGVASINGFVNEKGIMPTEIIAQYAQSVGFGGDSLIIAVAIALAESIGGHPMAHNTTGRDNSYGLWQINMYGSLGPSRLKSLGLRSYEDLFDPATNARAAYIISGGGKDFGSWTTYTHGTYKNHWNQALEAVKAVVGK